MNRHESGDAARDRFLRRGSRQIGKFLFSGKICFDDAMVVFSEAIEKAWQAVKEFLETDGALPTSVEWVANRDLPSDTFPEQRAFRLAGGRFVTK